MASFQRRPPALPAAAPAMLPDRAPEEWRDEAAPEERRVEAWLRAARGETQGSIARALGVSRQTVNGYLALEAKSRLSRLENSEIELEKIIGTLEAILAQSFMRAEQAFESSPASLAASNYLRLCLDAAREIARLRGLDSLVARREGTGPSKAQIIVRIGGQKDFEQVIEVGAQITEGE
jgi:transcriptional regulator with XRE-family HTH domain